MKVTVIDTGRANLLSVQRALAYCGAVPELTGDPAAVLAAEALVLPGVGAFGDGMAELRRRGLAEAICRRVGQGAPLLGICLGMQMLFDGSDEFGPHEGLGLIPGWVRRLPAADAAGAPQRVPHIAWEPLLPGPGRADFAGTALQSVPDGGECYFIHSYAAEPADDAFRLADCLYGGRRVAPRRRGGGCLAPSSTPKNPGRWVLASCTIFWLCAAAAIVEVPNLHLRQQESIKPEKSAFYPFTNRTECCIIQTMRLNF